jgi:uncharacterized protein YgiM (DUF1202 family)
MKASLVLFAVLLTACSASPRIVPSDDIRPSAPRFVATITVDAEKVDVHSEPSTSSPVVQVLPEGARVRLFRRAESWLEVGGDDAPSGWVLESSLTSSTCTHDRPEPRIVEEPVFRFEPPDGRHGVVVIEAEFTSSGELASSRVVENTMPDVSFERAALDDLHHLKFLPSTTDCKPKPFIYSFRRNF